MHPEVIALKADSIENKVVSDATHLIVTIDQTLRHCMCVDECSIIALSCKVMVLVSLELNKLVAPELETLVLVSMPYGECYHETIVDLSEMPDLKHIISLSNAFDLLHMPPGCQVYGDPRQAIFSDGKDIEAVDSPAIHRLREYFETPEVYGCSCFHYLPAGLDLFDLIADSIK